MTKLPGCRRLLPSVSGIDSSRTVWGQGVLFGWHVRFDSSRGGVSARDAGGLRAASASRVARGRPDPFLAGRGGARSGRDRKWPSETTTRSVQPVPAYAV